MYVSESNIKVPVEALISSSSITNPPILPPVNNTWDPVICPLDFSFKFPLELETAFDVIANPPISPEVAVILPLIWASEAVIWPLDFKISLLFELDIAVWVNPNEAIVPVPTTFKVPSIFVLPLNKADEPVISPFSLTLN